MSPCRRRCLFILAVVSILGSAGALVAQRPDAFSGSFDHAAIQYTTRPVETAVSRLNGDIAAGRVRLTFDAATGYLASLLAALDVPRDSQMLVFSETSAQAARIHPRNPRALFFNDVTMVGWVRGTDRLEVVTHDARQGPIFYTLQQSPTDRPQLTRDDTCLQCHLSWDTLAVPGLLTISTFPMSDDKNAYASGVVVDHRTPLEQRWGGWYVTGRAVPSRHFGNVPVIRPEHELSQPVAPAPRFGSVQGVFDTTNYLTLSSDVAALMVFAHQTHMTNLLTRLGWEARLAQGELLSGKPPTADRVRQAAHDVVDYMLMLDEAPITERMEGSSGFAERFSARGPRDSKGRSLRQLDLERRVFRYSCSYMIYADVFDALPTSAKAAVYERLWDILSGREAGQPYASLSRADRRAVVEILRDTKADLPPYFHAANIEGR
jgi:hypothetical protein